MPAPTSDVLYDVFNALHQLGDTPLAAEVRGAVLEMQHRINVLQIELLAVKKALGRDAPNEGY